jgi:hypothetical protein
MSDIQIPGTRQTPAVDFRFSAHRLSLTGEAYPENASAFFDPLLAAINAYVANGDSAPISMQLNLLYLNSASTKMVFKLVGPLDQAASQGRAVRLDFAVHEDDEVLRELGEDMHADYPWVDFNFVETADAA